MAGFNSSTAALSALLPATPKPAVTARDMQRGAKLRLFVYPLEWPYAGQIVEYVEKRARELLKVQCAYLREDTCPNRGFSHLENLRSHCTDVPILYKLLQAAHIEPDPAKADIFVVPFLMGCNAMLGWGHGMHRVNAKHHNAFVRNFTRFAREQLPHFATWPHRHLFLVPIDSMFAPKWLKGSMLAHTGSGYISSKQLDVPVPYLVSLPSASIAPSTIAASAQPRTNLVFLMASPSRNKVRYEVAGQLREARDGAGGGSSWLRSALSSPPPASSSSLRGHGIELYETDMRKEKTMPLSADETMRRMRDTTFCVAPTGDSDGFTQRFYYILAAGCIPVRVDTYYPDLSFGRVAWPSKQTIQWHRAVVLLPPEKLRTVGLLPMLANISDTQIEKMREYISRVVRPHVLFDYRGRQPDAFSAFLDELLFLAKERLPPLDKK